MANPIVQLPLSEGAKSAAALRSAHSVVPENDDGSKSNMKEATTPHAETFKQEKGEWSPSCKESSLNLHHLSLYVFFEKLMW